MPTFITQGRYTGQAIKGLLSNPEDRSEAVRALVESMGGRLVGWYMTFGEYDFLAISEAPDENAMLSILAVVGGGGSITDIKTTLAIAGASSKDAFAAAGRAAQGFRSAGQMS